MRQADSVMIAFLLSKEPFFMADLFTIDLPNYGETLRFTSFDQDVSYGGTVWTATGPLVTRTSWSIKNTLEVSTLSVTIHSTGDDFGGYNIKQLIHQGFFDNSSIILQRAVMQTPGDTSLGLIDLWYGVGGKVTGGARGVDVTWNSRNVSMLQQMPKNRYKTICTWSLYSPGCTMNKDTYTAPGLVDLVNGRFIKWQVEPVPGQSEHYANGFVVFTSGPAVGQRRSIDAAGPDGFHMATELYTYPNHGDSFNVTMGCDKTLGAFGCAFFNNKQHYRGFPYIPPATAAV